MPRKSLGRGLREISETYLTDDSADSDKSRPLRGFSLAAKKDATCASCKNFIKGGNGDLQCKIFTFKSKEFGVPRLEAITLNHAKYCEHFDSEEFIENTRASETPKNGEVDCDIVEKVSVRKKIAFPTSDDVHHRIKRELLKLLDQGYQIKNVELARKKNSFSDKHVKTLDEEISLYINEDT